MCNVYANNHLVYPVWLVLRKDQINWPLPTNIRGSGWSRENSSRANRAPVSVELVCRDSTDQQLCGQLDPLSRLCYPQMGRTRLGVALADLNPTSIPDMVHLDASPVSSDPRANRDLTIEGEHLLHASYGNRYRPTTIDQAT